MKAYVIKNKDGKYLGVCSSDYSHYWTSIDFAHYFRYLPNHDPKQEAEHFKNSKYPDCEVVEITITEVDLEYQLAITEKALELACKELIDNACIQCNNCNRYEMCNYVLSLYPTSYFIEEAKEMLENE